MPRLTAGADLGFGLARVRPVSADRTLGAHRARAARRSHRRHELSFAKTLTAFDIGRDGGLSNRRVWAELDGHPDGICIDEEGAVWATAGARCLRIREGGEVLEAIELDRMCFACMLGGEDGRTLFMVAAEWNGSTDLAGTEPTGKLFTARAPRPVQGGRKARPARPRPQSSSVPPS